MWVTRTCDKCKDKIYSRILVEELENNKLKLGSTIFDLKNVDGKLSIENEVLGLYTFESYSN